MVPRNASGVPWSSSDATRKLSEIRQAVIAEFKERDHRLGYDTGQKYISMSEWEGKPINPPRLFEAGRLRHSGEDVSKEVDKRWKEFCGSPQPL